MSPLVRASSAAACLLALVLFSDLGLAAAGADGYPAGNLLREAKVVDSLDVWGPPRSVVNDTIEVDGTPWTRGKGIRLQTPAAALTYDLGRVMPIGAVYLQADIGNVYSLQISDDGEHFTEIWKVPQRIKQKGLRTTSSVFLETSARFIRFGEPEGPGSAVVTELQIFARVPTAWPPPVVASIESAKEPPRARPLFRPLEEKELSRAKLLVGILGLALLTLSWFLGRGGTSKRSARLRDGLLLLLGITGLWGYFSWGPFYAHKSAHFYEFYHYYMGAKYFPEMGYTGLYECTSLAEAEMGFRRRVEHRAIRDLRTNQVVRATYILEEPERWKQGFIRPFTPERWEEFKHDIAYFQTHIDPDRWERMLQDHGYNPSPVWNIAGSLLANLGPASDRLIEGFLKWIDPALILLAFALIVWAFGWRIACIAALFFGTNDLGAHFWVGGAFLRMDWFFWAIAGLCLLKRGLPVFGGAALGISTLLRVFPGGFFIPLVLRLGWVFFRERRVDPAAARALIGAALVTALLVPVSMKVAGGWQAWPEFVRNTKKQTSSPMTNHVGMRTVLEFKWEERSKVSYDPTLVDPFSVFREARAKAFRENFLLFGILVAGYLGLLLFALQKEKEAWAWAVFGFGVVPMGLELTCYYYSFVLVAAFLHERAPKISIGLLLLSVLGQIVTLNTYFYDIRFYFHSLLLVTFVVWAAWAYARRPVSALPSV